MSEQLVVTARPVRMTKIGRWTAAFVVVLFIVIAFVMTTANAGVTFDRKDQVGTAILGLIIASGFLLLTRPSLIADETSVRSRSFLGDYRTIPWEVVVRVEFPAKARFARLVLPGDELLALYAVQRMDRQESVETMRRLRELFALTHPAPGPAPAQG